MFTLNPQSTVPLVLQIVTGFRSAIDDGSLRPGSKAPSIRQLAHAHNVSVFTVVDAYDRLVAQGYFASRPHSGFFVKQRATSVTELPGHGPNFSFDSMWYLRRIFENRALRMKPGCGWLPGDWLFQDGVRRGLRSLATDDVDVGGYGEPKGYLPLRKQVREMLAEQEVAVTAEQVLLTQGSSQAMDLVARRLIRAGDAVLVDDPGYPNLLFSLRFLGARLIGVPRTPAGYDLVALDPRRRPSVNWPTPTM
jgi:DNA-binding transcriptional MocR family regulator